MPLYGGGRAGGCSFSFPLCSDACVVFTWSSSSRACAQNSFSLNFVGGCACVGTLSDPPARRLLGDCCGQGWRGPPPGQRCAGPASPQGARRRLGAWPATSPAWAVRGFRGHVGHAVRCCLGPGRGRKTVAAAQQLVPLAALCFFSQCQWPRAGRGPASGCVLFSRGPVAPGRSRCCFRVRCFASGPVAPGVSWSCLRPF